MRPALDFGLMTPAARVIEELLVIAPEERLVVVHDRVNGDLARAFEHAGIEQKAQVERIDMEGLAARPWTTSPGEVLRALSKAAASILGDEAMHWAILRNALGEVPVPDAFVA